MATIDDIRQYFANILQRSGTEVSDAEINSYVSAVNSGALTLAQARTALINSPEGADVQDVVRLYQVVFGRVPDKDGLNFQVDTLRGPANELNIANGFAASAEFSARFGGNTVNTAFINAVYQQVLGRAPVESEVNFYLNSGFSAARIALAFSESPEFRSRADSAVVSFLDAAGQGTAVYTGPLGGGLPSGTPGVSLALTTAIDSLVGTANNDTFTGSVTFANATPASTSTLTIADSINGAAGTDRLNVVVDGTLDGGTTAGGDPVAFPAASISNVEQLFVRNVATETAAGDNLTINAQNVPGLTQAWNDRSTSTVAFTNLASGATVGVRGDGVVSVGDTFFSYATATDAVTIAVDGGVKATTATDVTNTGSGATTATITSTGGANALDVVTLSGSASIKNVTINATTALTLGAANNVTGIANGALDSTGAKITVAGVGAVDLNTLGAAVNEVDASTNSGGVTIDGGFEAGDKFTGGSGNDTLTVGVALTTGSANAGGGTGDRLIVTDDAAVATAALGAKFTGFEILRAAETAADTYNLANIAGITAVEVDGTTGATFTGVTSQTFSIIGDDVGDVTITNSAFTPGGSDAFALSLNNAVLKNANGVDAGNIALTNVDTLTLTSTGANLSSATESNSISSLAGSTDLNVVNINGDTNLSLTTGASAADTINAGSFQGILTLDASLSTAGITITSGSGNDAITGSAFADAINAGAGNNTITAGDGIDTITLTSGGNDTVVLNGVLSAANRDVVTGFTVGAAGTAGVDKISILAADTTNTTTSAGGTVAIQNVASAPNSGLTFNTAANDVLELSFNLAGDGVAGQDLDGATNGANLLAALGQTLSVSADTNKGYVVAYQGGNAYLYHVVEGADAGNTEVAAADIALVGVFNGVAVGGFEANNFILA